MGQLQYVMGEAGWPDPGPARGTPHLLPTGSPLQLTFSRSSSSSSTMSRRLFTARLDSFSCGKKTVCSHTNVGTQPHSAGRGLGSHLGQLVILIVEGEGPELRAVPVLLLVRPRPAHLQRRHAASAPLPSRPAERSPPPPPLTSPRSPSTPGSGTAAARHRRKGGRRAGHAGTGSLHAAFRPFPRRSGTASPGVHCAAPGAGLRLPALNAWRRGVGAFVGSRPVTAGLGATAGAASGAAGPGRSARRNGETWAGGRGKRRKGPCRCRKPGGGAGPAVLAVSTGGRSGGGGPDGQVGGGRPALDRGAAGGRHQRQQLALVSGRGAGRAGGAVGARHGASRRPLFS